MEPGDIRIILGDARELPDVADASIALVVTSPPYPMIEQWDGLFRELGARDFDGMHAVLAEAWRACHRVLVPGGLLAINIGDAVRTLDGEFRLWSNHARVTHACEGVGFRSLPYVLWKKPTNKPNAFLGSGFSPPNAYVTLDCEFVLLFRKGDRRAFPAGDPRRAVSRYTRPERDRWFSQIWSDVRGRRQEKDGRRTAAFPPAIPERLIRMFSVVGDTVLDPFAGTGTTLWVASELGRRAVGVERDPVLVERLRARARSWTGTRRRSSTPPGARVPRSPRDRGTAARNP
ncbi:MAG: site-specific DNA-methyltransferase [Thermoplasmata archaeon]|nr:site-specific DNA-methyltransferase [Thermoplasmata archaeon]